MPYLCSSKKTSGEGACARRIRAALMMAALGAGFFELMAPLADGQTNAPSLPGGATAPTAAQVGPSSYQGSVPVGEATAETVDLTLDDAIARGLRNNLGVILSGTQTATAKAQRMSQLQGLLPNVDAT